MGKLAAGDHLENMGQAVYGFTNEPQEAESVG